ncbi:MAG: CoA transferase [Rhodospirillaceae bacterium]|nr:formyl-CoA transferase [Rhodospirillaceae bacterium]MAJ93182.1 formyl-CoA transferase [Rhodospirillaceae bacterium]RPF95401.1 MAG: CoA transferase [Rhodospirillaceae bacterium TMED63]RPG00075.1 MAG: CoA transferase [Rhodospirillaceae bacterium TMED63]RZO36583.1 MAG: CoA transferase [Rhodospirillaceae bacterium]
MGTESAPRSGPLTNIRVIEMGTMIAGPFCGQLLADHGAEVIKLEQPEIGDPMRQWGKEKPHGKALFWPVLSRNKLSATLNARGADGRALVKKLVEDADILLENFRPGTMERWGLSYEDLSAINPKLIMIRVSGFGQTGPYAKRAGYGAIGEAMGGLRYTTGDPSLPPSRAGISIGDSLAAMHACLGAMMALHQVHLTGKGQVIDASIYESVLNMMENIVTEYDVGDYIRERTGSFLPKIAPSNIYPTKDGIWLVIGANQDSVWARMADAMERPELATDERYATHGARGINQIELDELISAWTKSFSAADLEERLNEFGIPNGKIYRPPEMLVDPQFQARDSIVRVDHPEFGNIAMQNVTPRLSETQGGVRHPGPALGEHNDYVWGTVAGKSAEEISDLRDRGII